MKPFLKQFAMGGVLVFALIGFVFTAVFFAMQLGLLNVRGSIAERNAFFLGNATTTLPAEPCDDKRKSVCAWSETPEWDAVKGGLIKDAGVLGRVSAETGIPARMIAAVVVPEQMRFFTSNREVFKRYFEPLKILGSLSQFSLGVSGIKEDTAKAIEAYAADPSSAFYPGAGMSALIEYAPGADRDAELYNRLTDAKDHYYSLLYTALYIKEVEMQWARAGFDISDKPGTIATLFNIGFANSHPNAAPRTAGAGITAGGQTYAYGELGAEFYASNELSDVLPK
ncbi:MAG TPA: hypothetical protein VHD37_02190 [Candidatus Paceibacterota bacterium]|nr:hypothetical protein [Candidatus Paceibacterota bacterium]